MSEMDKLFGSDSEESGENEDEQHNEQSNNEQHEGSDNNDEDNGDGEHNDENTNDNNNENDEEEHTEEHHDDENNHNDDEDDDDDDEVIKKKVPKQAAEVFGDELADLSDSDDNEQNNESRGANEEAEDEDHERGDQDGEEGNEEQVEAEEEEEVETEQLIDIEIPRVKTDLGKEVHFVKLPNFLSVEPRPFDRETYEDENPKGEALDEEGKTRVRLKVENTIRWRYEKDSLGNDVKQSNARIVKWSDGSLSLYLGNEIFDVYKTAMQGDHNHLFVRQGNVLHGQTVFKTKLTFRPYSIDSMTHRKMTMSLVEHGSKTKKVKILNEMAKNPENKRQELMKQEEEKLKAASRRQNQQRRMREKSHSKGLSANYLEDRYQSDEDTGGISISDIKNKFKRGVAAGSSKNVSIYSSSDESDRERRLNKAKSSHNDSDSGSGHESAMLDDDDDDDIDRDRKAHSTNKKKKVVMDDEDE